MSDFHFLENHVDNDIWGWCKELKKKKMPTIIDLMIFFSSQEEDVQPGSDEHPLQFKYTFWFSRRTPGKQTSSQNYDQNLKRIGTFASVSSLLPLTPVFALIFFLRENVLFAVDVLLN